MYVGEPAYAKACVWRWEDFGSWLSPSFEWVLGIKHRLSSLAARAFIY